jgi:hypothetical protein
MAGMASQDFAVSNEGSMVLLSALSAEAKDWVEEFIPSDAQMWAGAVVIESRYINDILNGIQDSGLSFVN